MPSSDLSRDVPAAELVAQTIATYDAVRLGADFIRRAVFLQRADVKLLLRGLHLGEQATLALAHALFGGDLEQAGGEFPLLETLGRLAPAQLVASHDLARPLEPAGHAAQRRVLFFG